MYAVVRTGGKQYRVTAGDIFEVEKLDGNVGDTLTLDDVLLVSSDDDVRVGQPIVEGARVVARITGQYRGKKILVFRYRPKKRIRVRRGHRQYLTRLEVESVSLNGSSYSQEDVQREREVELAEQREAELVVQRELEAKRQAELEAQRSASPEVANAAASGDEPIVDATKLPDAPASQPVVDGEETPADAPAERDQERDGSADEPVVVGMETAAATEPTTTEPDGEPSAPSAAATSDVAMTTEAEGDPTTDPDNVETLDDVDSGTSNAS